MLLLPEENTGEAWVLATSNVLLEIEKHWIETYLHFSFTTIHSND
jgi:hypothetical protein